MSGNTEERGDYRPQQTREELNSHTYSENVQFVGKALIVNNVIFKGPSSNGCRKREGSEIDADGVKDLLERLGFKGHIKCRKNLTKKQLKKEIETAAGENYEDFGCFVCVIMSYGEPGIIICPGEEDKFDDRCEIKDIQAPFTGDKCKTLATKPKIYFIMGNSNYREEHAAEGYTEKVPSIKLETRKIPRECNFITQFSAATDHGNWGQKKRSPYISAIIEAFENHVLKPNVDLDVLKVMTRINEIMVNKDADIPLVTTLLTKRYHFRPKFIMS